MSDVKITTKDPFDIIKRSVRNAVDLVAPTYGPAGNKVLISRVTHKLVVDDGVQIMRDMKFDDTNENAILDLIRETAVKTNDRAGDGTTGSMIMLGSIIEEVSKIPRREGHKIERQLKQGLKEATEQLKVQAKPVKTLQELEKVARISFDNAEVSDLIADTWHKVGKDGVVTVEVGPSMVTTAELSEGIQIDHGYISPVMVNNPERMECIIEKPMILITDMRITEGEDLMPLMDLLVKAGKPKLLVIADNVEQTAIATLVINEPHVLNPHTQKPGVLQSVAVVGPSGEDKEIVLEDIAMLTGGRVFSMNKGDKIQDAKIEDLGSADRVIVQQESCVIIGSKGDKKIINKAMGDLAAAANMEQETRKKEKLQKRLAFFANKIAIMRVGAPTANEQRALRYKVEDAVNSVRSAYRGGVVCGAGLSLAQLETSSPILNAALQAPHRQLLNNMGLELERPLKEGEAFNVVTGKTGKFLEVGVIDPVEVLIAGIESAVSIASLLVTLSGMIVEKPQKLRQE